MGAVRSELERAGPASQFDIWEAVFSPYGRRRLPETDLGPEAHRRDRPRRCGLLARELRSAPHPRTRLGRRSDRSSRARSTSSRRRHGQLLSQQRGLPHRGLPRVARPTPTTAGVVDYGDRAEHCWNGDPTLPNAISRLRYNTMYVPRILERIQESAPPGADTTSWRH